MPGKVDLFNIGSVGIDLTKSKIHADDGSLRSAQNAVPDTRGEYGGLAKRDGLVAINSSTAGGSILGALHVPLPAITTRTVWLGQQGATDSLGWAYSTDAFATAASTVTGNGPPGEPRAKGEDPSRTTSPEIWGRAACIYNNKIYFARSRLLGSGGPPTIWVWDGSVEREVCRLPNNAGSASTMEPKVILDMVVEGDYIYLSTWHSGQTPGPAADLLGDVFRFHIPTGALEQLGARFPAGFLPVTLCFHANRLWAGTWSDSITASGRVYFIRPGIDTDWTLDHTTTASQGEVISLATYKGLLYAATQGRSLAGLVKVRSQAGVWTTSDTGSAATALNGYYSLLVFGDNLYATYSDVSGLTWSIRKFDGTSWSTATSAAVLGEFYLFANNSVMYAFRVTRSGSDALYTTPDGTTWTDRSSSTSSGFFQVASGAIIS